MSKELNFVFFGTPDVASETLEILKQNGYTPSLIVTSPDKPQGRKMLLTSPPAKIWAMENNIQYTQPEELNNEVNTFPEEGLRGVSPKSFFGEIGDKFDLFVVVAYGKIMPEEILNMPKLGSINIHYSLLPKYRGASPVESAILNGDTETGVTIQKMKFKMDSGPIIAQEKLEILSDEKASELRTRLIKLGGELLVKTLTPSPDGLSPLTGGELILQDESQATFCKKIAKEDGLLNLGDNAVKNYNKFRAYATWPRTFFFKDDKRFIVTQAHLENDSFVIEKVIPEGGKETSYKN